MYESKIDRRERQRARDRVTIRAQYNLPRTLRSNEAEREGESESELAYCSLRDAALCPYERERDSVAALMCESERELDRAKAERHTAACMLPRKHV